MKVGHSSRLIVGEVPRPPACVKTTLRDAATTGAGFAARLAQLALPTGLRVLAFWVLTQTPGVAPRFGQERNGGTIALRAHVERGERRPRMRFTASTRALSTGAVAVGDPGPVFQSCREMEGVREFRGKVRNLRAMGGVMRKHAPTPLGRQITRRRKALGLTREALATRMIGLAISHGEPVAALDSLANTLYRYESGRIEPSGRSLRLLCDALRCDPADLYEDRPVGDAREVLLRYAEGLARTCRDTAQRADELMRALEDLRT